MNGRPPNRDDHSPRAIRLYKRRLRSRLPIFDLVSPRPLITPDER